jgi:hypothetical protein
LQFAPATDSISSFYFNGDTDTGIQRRGANTLGLVAGGANVLIVTNGCVGIATNNPVAGVTLDVNGNMRADKFYFGDNTNAWIEFSSTNFVLKRAGTTNAVLIPIP